MKKKTLFLGIIAIAIIIGFSMISCAEEEEDTGPKIPYLPEPKPADIAADIRGAKAPTINSEEDAVSFLSTVFSSVMSNMQTLDMSIFEDILNEIISGTGILYSQRQVYTQSKSIDINLADYANDLDEYGVNLNGNISGLFTYSFNDRNWTTTANGNVNADCSFGYDHSKNTLINTDDVLVMDIKLKANGLVSMIMSDNQEKISVTAGAASSFAMAYLDVDTNEGAKIIITAGYAGSVNLDLMDEYGAIPDIRDITGNVTLSIYDAENNNIYAKKMSLEELMYYILIVEEDVDYID